MLPTIHEGPSVRQMESRGIRTDKGEFNRWIKTTNSIIRDIKKKIVALLDWLKEAKAELSEPKAPDFIILFYWTAPSDGPFSAVGGISL